MAPHRCTFHDVCCGPAKKLFRSPIPAADHHVFAKLHCSQRSVLEQRLGFGKVAPHSLFLVRPVRHVIQRHHRTVDLTCEVAHGNTADRKHATLPVGGALDELIFERCTCGKPLGFVSNQRE